MKLVEDGEQWRPERFEFAFGLPGDLDRDPRSVAEPARVDGRFLIRGSIDLVERRLDGTALRVTDHKTGKNRTNAGHDGRWRPRAAADPLRHGPRGDHRRSASRRAGCRSARRWAGSASTPLRSNEVEPTPRARSARSDRPRHRARHARRASGRRRLRTLRLHRRSAAATKSGARGGSRRAVRRPRRSCAQDPDDAPPPIRSAYCIRPIARSTRRSSSRRQPAPARRRARRAHRRCSSRSGRARDHRNRRRHLQRESRRRTETPVARGARARARRCAARERRVGSASTRPFSSSRKRTSAPFTGSAPSCCASVRSRRRSIRPSK